MKSGKGFTLIELLVVIAIIGLLSSVVLASLSSARMKARDARRIADLGQIMTALELYYDANGYYPGATDNGGTNSALCTVCGAVPTWDCNGYLRSYISGAVIKSWDTLRTALAPYITTLPIDPLNSACDPWQVATPCYSYAYGNPGRNTKPTYDLVARLETPNHSLNCGNNNWKFYFGVALDATGQQYEPNGESWCFAPNTYPVDLYDPSPN